MIQPLNMSAPRPVGSIEWRTPVPAKKLCERRGLEFVGNTRLGKIEKGKVPCLHVETAQPAQCAFSKRGTWLDGTAGDFARIGQAIPLDGKPGSDYVVAAKVNRDASVSALESSGRDSAGSYVDARAPARSRRTARRRMRPASRS
jgi:hypothetical protein